MSLTIRHRSANSLNPIPFERCGPNGPVTFKILIGHCCFSVEFRLKNQLHLNTAHKMLFLASCQLLLFLLAKINITKVVLGLKNAITHCYKWV